jgi:hypothetical protein
MQIHDNTFEKLSKIGFVHQRHNGARPDRGEGLVSGQDANLTQVKKGVPGTTKSTRVSNLYLTVGPTQQLRIEQGNSVRAYGGNRHLLPHGNGAKGVANQGSLSAYLINTLQKTLRAH